MKKTMKQHSFTARLKSLAVVFGIAMAFASCANEDVAQNPTNPNEDNDKNLTTFVTGDETKTRTSMDYNSGDFYWEAGDYIFVKDDDGTWQMSNNAPTSKVTSFKYKVPGKFNNSTSYKVYYLGKYGYGHQVTISTYQTQTTPDNTDHVGTAGDYGSATATKVTGKQQFQFTLEHQPAYLVFQPYTSNTILKKCYLTKVEVISDNDIAETYTINSSTDNLDGSAGSKQIVLNTVGSSNPNGFPLTNSSASRTTNGAYMIIKPGTHALRVRYWIRDVETNVEGTITKLLPSIAYASNTYYDITANLNIMRNYDGDHYYMWDAQQQYWYGYEWNKNLPAGTRQPISESQPAGNYAQSSTDLRYWNQTSANPRYDAIHSCADLPNANEMAWYAKEGSPHWDNEVWTSMGHLYAGGMWFKKKSYISGFNSEIAPDGTDWRKVMKFESWSTSTTPLSASEVNYYFFLPAFGYYENGKLRLSHGGNYWSSSAQPYNSDGRYCLYFSASNVSVDSGSGHNGMRAQKFSDFGDN